MRIRPAQSANRLSNSSNERLEFEQLYVDRGAGQFLIDVLEGLGRSPASFPYYYFYDRRGSELFERITELPEYYLTNCEREILASGAAEILEQAGRPQQIVEFGSGSAEKTRILLTAALELHDEVCFVPIDISGDALRLSADQLIRDFPRLRIHALAAEYRQGLQALPTEGPPRLLLFMGSSIGNLDDEEAIDFLREIRAVSRSSDRLLVGADLAKSSAIVEPAYNDSQGVTAEFNLNVLRRINNELGGNFDLSLWQHEARYLPDEGLVEMRLVSLIGQTVRIEEREFTFGEGDFIRTERCRKYSEANLGQIVRDGGFETIERWYDAKNWFTVRLLRPIASEVEGRFF